MSAPESAPRRGGPPGPGELRPFRFPPVTTFTAASGVEVRLVEARDLPIVTFGVLLHAGAAEEDPSLAGLATLTADLVETGAGGRTGAEIAATLEGLGALHDVNVTWDSTYGGFTALRERADEAAAVLADVLFRPDFPAAEVDRLRGERLAAIAQRRANPGALASEAILREVYDGEVPFARPLGGWQRTVEGVTREAAATFHTHVYGGARRTAIVVGDLGREEADALVSRNVPTGAVRGDGTGDGIVPQTMTPRFTLVHRPGSVQAEIRAGHGGIARIHPDFEKIVVMNQILGGGFSSRLNLNLRERHGFTYGISASFTPRRSAGPFLVSTAVQSEVAAAAITEILREVETIRAEPVSREELEDARSYLAGVFPLSLETTGGIASRLVQLALFGFPDDYYSEYLERILAVTVADVLDAARAHVTPEALSFVVVGDAEALAPQLEGLGRGPVRVIAPEDLESEAA